MKTSDLIGPALDWAVAKCEGWAINITQGVSSGRPVLNLIHPRAKECSPSTNWSQGGPLIGREWIDLETRWNVVACGARSSFKEWRALHPKNHGGLIRYSGYGPTPLIAAMRCLVASKLGDEVEIPEELCK